MTERVLAVDPGRDKCGVAVVDGAGAVLHRKVVPTRECEDSLRAVVTEFSPSRVLLGNATWSKQVRPLVEAAAPGVPVEVVDERHTTERARALYWEANPPRGLWRLVPLGLQVPSEPYDDFAAIVIARDFLNNSGAGRRPNPAL